MRLHQPEDVAAGRIGVHPEQQVRRRQVEEAERVRLDQLGQVDDATQVGGRLRDLDRHDRVARLGRGDQVADRADPADPGHQARHLVERPALAQLLEAPELGDVELRVLDHASVVELDRDLRVPLDPA